jgi:hypothetical protein
MWMSETSPFSRLNAPGAPRPENKELWLPGETSARADHVRRHRSEILDSWNANSAGREWIVALDSRPPAGIWPQSLNDPLIAFKPVRKTVQTSLARAYALALDGNRDEAVQSLIPLIRAMHSLQRTGGNLVHEMIANVGVRQCYRVAAEILQQGPVSAETRTLLQQSLETALATQQVFRNAFLGERDMVHDVFDQLRKGQKRFSAPLPKGADRWIEIGVVVGGKWILNANHTESLIARWYAQICAFAEARDMKALENWMPEWSGSSQLKNPVGRITAATILPAFRKSVDAFWAAEDKRLALIHQLVTMDNGSTPSTGPK